jgi:glucose/arabinose dehydrogenase
MYRFLRSQILICTIFCLVSMGASAGRRSAQTKAAQSNSGAETKTKVLTGQDAFTDAAHESPGTRRHLTVNDLPAPNEKESVDNGPSMVPKPADAWPKAPAGFKVEQYTTGLDNPRLMRTAPNGDLFVAESQPGKILVFRGVTPDGKPQQTSVFAEGLHQPFGIAF